MEWTDADRKALLAVKEEIDSDDIKIKEQIKKLLLQNKMIIHVLNNKELEAYDSEADDYFGVNILPYYMINPTQYKVENYICYEVAYEELMRYNNDSKKLNIIFYVLSEHKNLVDSETGVARHDLLAALLQKQFNHTNYFGPKIELKSDIPTTVDTDYACRTLVFEQITDNNLVKTVGGTSKLANKEVHTFGKN